MQKKNLSDKELIHELINQIRQIKFIYDNMNIKNKDKFRSQLDEAQNLEDTIFHELNITKKNPKVIKKLFHEELENCFDNNSKREIIKFVQDQNLKSNLFDYLNIIDKKNELTMELITERFYKYIIKEFKDKKLKEEKYSTSLFLNQLNIEYKTSIIKFLNELESKSTSEKEINQIIKIKNNILFENKEISENTDDFIPKDYLNTSDEKIKNIYLMFVNDKLNEYERHCFYYNNKENDPNKKIKYDIHLQYFKAALYLSNIESLKEVAMDYETQFIKNKDISRNILNIFKAMNEVIELKESEKSKKALKV